MGSTDGLSRGLEVKDTGGEMMMPVGTCALGRVLNLLGEPIDGGGPLAGEKRMPIHRPAPVLEEQRHRRRCLSPASR